MCSLPYSLPIMLSIKEVGSMEHSYSLRHESITSCTQGESLNSRLLRESRSEEERTNE